MLKLKRKGKRLNNYNMDFLVTIYLGKRFLFIKSYSNFIIPIFSVLYLHLCPVKCGIIFVAHPL